MKQPVKNQKVKTPNFKVNDLEFAKEEAALTEIEVQKLAKIQTIIFIDKKQKLQRIYELERQNYQVTEQVYSPTESIGDTETSSHAGDDTSEVQSV